MNLPQLSIRKPTMVVMICAALMIMGVVSLFRLPVELYPNTNFGEISIVIYVRGEIPPSEVEAQVTKIVEEAVATTSHLHEMLSITKEGESTVVLRFEPGTNMEFAALEVREKFAKIKNKLPKEIEKPIIAQFKQSDVPVLVVAMTSSVRKPEEIRKIVDDWAKERFKRVSGVANVEVAGGRERKILVEIDQQKLVAYGITMEEITGTLSENNLNLLSGEVERKEDKLLVRMIGEFDNIDQIKEIAVRRTEYNSVIRLQDLANVKDGYLDAREYSRLNVKDTVSIYLQKESTANTITVVKEALHQLDEVKKELPKDIHVVVTSNQAMFIQKAIESLKGSLTQGTMLIFLILFIFLFKLEKKYLIGCLILMVLTMFLPIWVLNITFPAVLLFVLIKKQFRPLLIVVSPIPIAVLATFLYMRFAGLTLNVMTLFGLALGVGMLVDNSIVVFDNILKKRESGKNIPDAAEHGSQELILSMTASTLATIIVFLPMTFMSKEIQLMYSSMAITVVFSLLASLLCAITLVPLVSSKRFFAEPMAGMINVENWVEKIYPKERKYLLKFMRNTKKVIIFTGLFFLASMIFFTQIPADYLGSTEQNKFTVYIEMPTGTKLEVSDQMVKKVEELVREIPEASTISSRIEPWSSKIYVELKPATERKRSISEIIDALRPATSRLTPAFVYFEQEEQVGTKEIVIEVFGYDYKTLRQLAIGIANRMESIQGLADLKIRMREGRPEMGIHVDKNRAAALGVSTQAVADQVHAAMRGLRATLYHEEGQEIETITRLEEKYRKTFRDLYKMVISAADGTPVLLEQVANFKFDLGPSEIWRKNRERMIQVSASLGKVPLSKTAEKVKRQLNDLQFPENYFYRIGGDYEKLMRSQVEMRWVIVMVILLVYLVLASLFESFSQPLLIMIAVPLALGGALTMIYLGPRTIGVGALLGMMLLAGIVVNHSIMLMDRINFYRREYGLGHIRSVIRANKDRLRPILLTTTTTILGLVPMALDKGEGANLWSPLALTVIGGLISSMVLTLAVMPSFYIVAVAAARSIQSPAQFQALIRSYLNRFFARFLNKSVDKKD